MTQAKWNATLYEEKHAFVWNHGSELIDILAPQANERILDIGCGTGQLRTCTTLVVKMIILIYIFKLGNIYRSMKAKKSGGNRLK